MDRRIDTLRLSLGIPCIAGRFIREINQWKFFDSLIRKEDHNQFVLEIKQIFMLGELIKIRLLPVNPQNTGYGYLRSVCTTENNDFYREARVVRCYQAEVDGNTVYEIFFTNQLLPMTHHNLIEYEKKNQNDLYSGAEESAGKGNIDLIELAFAVGIKNKLYRSGEYDPESTHNSGTDMLT